MAVAALALLLTGCGSTDATQQPDLRARHGLAGMAAAEIVDHLDRLGDDERPADLTASVRPGELLLSDDGGELALDLPADRFYLSVAPYVDGTHECFHHSLTTCRGELAGDQGQVSVVDASGTVLVDEQMTTFANGFLGLWLPRDIAGTVQVTADGRTGEVPFATGDDDPTCLTTLRLG
jgi:hypothetical protein